MRCSSSKFVVMRLAHSVSVVALGLTALVLEIGTADACSPAADSVSNYLPKANATEVPLDMALIAGSNRTGIILSLRRANGTDTVVPRDGGATPDAGTSELPIVTTCHRTEGGELCVGKPSELEPSTRYEWKAELPSSSFTLYTATNGNTVTAAEWHSFTTGTAALGNAGAGTVQASVIRNERVEGPATLCGWPGGYATLQFSGTELASPLLIALAGLTPSNLGSAIVISDQQSLVELTISGPPECVMPELYDVTGQRRVLDMMCLEELLPATVTVVADPAAPSAMPAATVASTTIVAPDAASTMPAQGSALPSGDTPQLNATEPSGSDKTTGCGITPSPRGDALQFLFALLTTVGAYRSRRPCAAHRRHHG